MKAKHTHFYLFLTYLFPKNSLIGVRIISLLIIFLLPSFAFSQLSLNVINKGVAIGNTNDSVVIFGNVIHDDNGCIQDGYIQNDGHIYIAGNWTNDNYYILSQAQGKIGVPGHSGWVHFDSAQQIINSNITPVGTVTYWNSLELAGNDTATKFLRGASTEIEDILKINQHEFSADTNTVFVLNTDTAAIVIDTSAAGFISSLENGGLARYTDTIKTYFFPVGSSVGTTRYRPVDIKPVKDSANIFKVRMANVDPSNDTDQQFPITTKAPEVGDINNKYYHRVGRLNGSSPADITIYYNKDTDDINGDFDILTYWAEASQWDNPGLGSAVPYAYSNDSLSRPNNALKFSGFNNFNSNLQLTPIALSYNVILAGEIFVANVFSPNGDGFNDFIFARGRGLDKILFIIYDRWGEKIFETTDLNVGWDGTYKGQSLNTAVFVYVVKGTFKNGEETIQKGNITLLR